MTNSFLISENGWCSFKFQRRYGCADPARYWTFGNTVCLYAQTTTFLRKFCTVGNFREAKSTVLKVFKTEDGVNLFADYYLK